MTVSPSQTSAPASVLLAGGGTTGHVAPLLATAAELQQRWPGTRVTVLGATGGIEERLVPAAGLDLELISKVAFPRRPNAAAVRFPGALREAINRTGQIIDKCGAQVIVGFGGYVSPPAYIAARRRGLPIVIHEQNAKPGLANRLGARWTPYVATTFSSTKLPGATRVGLPMRREIVDLDVAASRAAARLQLGLDADRPTVLVTGGSLGAQRLNEAFAGAQEALAAAGVQVVHVTGRGKGFTPQQHGVPYVVQEYTDRMDQCYAAADLVVTRAGAGMVNEVAAVGVPAIFVPLPIGNGEQRLNAADTVTAGGALLVDDAAVTPAWVGQVVVPLATDPSRLETMRTALAGLHVEQAAARLVDLIARAATEAAKERA